MTKEEIKKLDNYGIKVMAVLSELFDEDSDNYIESPDFTLLFHAISTVAPNVIYKKFTGDDRNNLEFNHLMNQLCFQYSNRQSED